MANVLNFDPTANAYSSSGLGGVSNAINGGQLAGGSGGSNSTAGVGGVPSVTATPGSTGSGSAIPAGNAGAATAITPSISSNSSMTGSGSSGWDTPVAGATATPGISANPSLSGAGVGSAITQRPVQSVTGQKLDSFYGPTGNMTLPEYQQWQADEFNKNQLAAQGQFNQARSQMPYNTTGGGLANPYDQYVANPATPGQASAAFQSPANTASWNNSGLASQVANPGSLATGNTFAANGGQDYQNNQLNFLLRTLQNYGGLNGQNQFGNGFSPVFTGSNAINGGLVNGLGNSSSNPGGYQSSNIGNGQSFGLAQLLPLLMGLAGNNSNMSPQAGTYGNLGNQIFPSSSGGVGYQYDMGYDPNKASMTTADMQNVQNSMNSANAWFNTPEGQAWVKQKQANDLATYGPNGNQF